MHLRDFFDYKNQLMKDLLSNEKIVRLLASNTSIDKPEDLAYTQVFPYEYVPETAQEGKSYICFDVDIAQSYNKTYYAPTLYIWVFSHRSTLRLPEGGVRPDEICAEICEQINGSMEYGLGELTLYSTKRFAPVTDYQGKRLEFHASEFNKTYNGGKYIPSNRKHAL